MWAAPRAFWATVLLWLITVASSDLELDFEAEPTSRLVKISESRAVFRCIATSSFAKIRWLYKGQPIPHSYRWIRVSHHKLTVLLGRMDKSLKSPHILDNAFFQCEIRLKDHVLVSAPAKLVVAALNQFPPGPDVHIAAYVGNTAVIPCDPPYSEPTVVTEFTFNETAIVTSTERQKLMPSGDLQIFNVSHEDFGEYRCIANNPFLMKKVESKRKVILHIEDPIEGKPPSIMKSPKTKLAVALGSNVTLECVASGSPTPVISWRKHHGSLPHSRHQQIGGNLLIISIRRGDEGKYICEAENTLGLKMSESTIEVQETPQIIKPLRSLSLEAGDNITLNCVTRGHPKPVLTWIHNGRKLFTGPQSRRSPLIIENVNSKHSGIYQCFASNELGTVYSSAEVSVNMGNKSMDSDYDDYDDGEEGNDHPGSHHGKDKNNDYDILDPEDHDYVVKRPHKKKHKGVKLIPPSKPYITRLTNTSVMVRWNVPHNDGLPILFFKVQYKEVGKRNSAWETVEDDIAAHIHSYAVINLKTGAAYRFQIAAVYSNNDNKSGPISSKFILLKDPPMEKPSTAPIITFAEAASPSAITLHWEYEHSNSIPVEGFFIHYRDTHTAGKYLKVTVLGANTRSHIISYLLPDTGYDMKMQCFNDAGTSDFSNIYTSKTKPAEVVPGSRNRNKAQSDDADISLTETVSSRDSESNFNLYIILGSVCGVLLLAVSTCSFFFFRQKQNTDANHGNADGEGTLKVGNGYVTSNGYIAVRNKMNINVNPLSHLDIEDAEKPDELEDIVSNNNEIIRLQTFSVSADHTAEPLLDGSEEDESEFNGDQTEAVIVPCDSEVAAETQDK